MSFEKLIKFENKAMEWWGKKETDPDVILNVLRQYENYLEDTKNVKIGKVE